MSYRDSVRCESEKIIYVYVLALLFCTKLNHIKNKNSECVLNLETFITQVFRIKFTTTHTHTKKSKVTRKVMTQYIQVNQFPHAVFMQQKLITKIFLKPIKNPHINLVFAQQWSENETLARKPHRLTNTLVRVHFCFLQQNNIFDSHSHNKCTSLATCTLVKW